MNVTRCARTLLVCASVLSLAACTVRVPFVNASTVDKARKAYELQQKLSALAFSVRSDPNGGQLAFIATKDVKGFPVSLSLDLAQSPMTRAVSLAGLAIPLNAGVPSFDGVPEQLAGRGVPQATVTEMQGSVNAAIEAVNALGM